MNHSGSFLWAAAGQTEQLRQVRPGDSRHRTVQMGPTPPLSSTQSSCSHAGSPSTCSNIITCPYMDGAASPRQHAAGSESEEKKGSDEADTPSLFMHTLFFFLFFSYENTFFYPEHEQNLNRTGPHMFPSEQQRLRRFNAEITG